MVKMALIRALMCHVQKNLLLSFYHLRGNRVDTQTTVLLSDEGLDQCLKV